MNRTSHRSVSALSAGFCFAVCVVGPLLVGHAIERRYGWRPWGVLAGLVFGLAVGVWGVLRPLWLAADEPPSGENRAPSAPADRQAPGA